MQSLQGRRTSVARTLRIRDAGGELQTSPESICEVFACFYADLYEDPNALAQSGGLDKGEELPITSDEVVEALQQLKN